MKTVYEKPSMRVHTCDALVMCVTSDSWGHGHGHHHGFIPPPPPPPHPWFPWFAKEEGSVEFENFDEE